MEPLLVSRKEGAALLGISVRKLDYLIEGGKLLTRQIGARVLLPYSGLRKFAGEAAKSQKATAGPNAHHVASGNAGGPDE